MKNTLRVIFWGTLVFAIVVAVACWGAKMGAETEAKRWNDGICECGGHYQLFDIEKTKGDEYYYYKCDKCDNILRSTHCFKKG